jgi:hypothetical protein
MRSESGKIPRGELGPWPLYPFRDGLGGEDKALPLEVARTTATVNGRSMNIRAPMPTIRRVWPDVRAGWVFEWAAYPAAGVVVFRRVQ